MRPFHLLFLAALASAVAVVVAAASELFDLASDVGAMVGLLIGAASFMALMQQWVLTRVRRLEIAQRELPAPDSGVLICDAADEKTLLSVARQVKAELLPTRSERKRTREHRGAFSMTLKVLTFGGRRSRGYEDMDVFEDSDDMNVLLGRVLRALNDKRMLHRGLARVPRLALEPDDRFDDSEAIGNVIQGYMQSQFLQGDLQLVGPPRHDPERGVHVRSTVNYDQLVEDIVAQLKHEVPLTRVATQLRRRWSRVSDGNLVLVEGPWRIEQIDGGLVLTLAGLVVDDGDGSTEQTVEMPSNLAVVCHVLNAMMLDHRSGRLRPGHEMTLGVFGQVSRRTTDNDRTLTLEPTAIFERLAAPG